MLPRLLGHPLEKPPQDGACGIHRNNILSGRVFHTAEQIVRADAQSVCQPAKRLRIREPTPRLEMADAHLRNVGSFRKLVLRQPLLSAPLSKPFAKPLSASYGVPGDVRFETNADGFDATDSLASVAS